MNPYFAMLSNAFGQNKEQLRKRQQRKQGGSNHSSLITIHMIPSTPAPPTSSSSTAPRSAPSTPSTLPQIMHILHLLDRHSLRLTHTLRQHHGLIPTNHLLIDILSKCVFDALEDLGVVLRYETNCLARFAGTSGTADAMNIGVAVLGEVEIDDEVDGWDVETAGCDVGGDEYVAGF